ncbi:MAG TPA: sialate O-acetylesterase [Bacteroidota bacterium]|nr:sialate O-acetylesterase [Bacteroidota bacterium]
MTQSSVRFQILTFLILVMAESVISQSQPFQFASVFTDSMVLQQQSKVWVWGEGQPGKSITIRASWNDSALAEIDSQGVWYTTIQTARAGGPYELRASDGDTTLTLCNVLLGEVWLCSGQSNMEMPLEGWPPTSTVMNSDSEIAHANYSEIRLFTVKRAYAIRPDMSCDGKWVECTPENARTFSATAYFFGRMLYERLHVPIGLIHSSWGGTAIESWINKQDLSKIDRYVPILKKLDESTKGIDSLNEWIESHPVVKISGRSPATRWTNMDFNDAECKERDFNDSLWKEMKLPTVWEATEVGEFDGAVWFRKRISLPSEWRGKVLLLDLGPIDDMDETYVNGQSVGKHLTEGMWQVPRSYSVPQELSRDSILEIAVRVIDYGGGGGIWGKKGELHLSRTDTALSIPLDGSWKYLPVAEYTSSMFYVFGSKGQEYNKRPKLAIDFSGYSPTALFNGMISPLVPFTLRGVIWYQGESNVGHPSTYASLFPMMIDEWRSVFRTDLPFYYVQIAPYKYDSLSQSQFLREAQFKTLSVKNTGMAVTLDIGNPDNIHPADKQDVGKRLALWALAKTYRQHAIVCSGPIYRSMKIKKNIAVLSFDDVGKGLVLREDSSGSGFQIAGEDKQFKDATVKIKGSTLLVSSPEVHHPLAVRYAFSNAPHATLFNKEGLPASSFRTDEWDEKR